MSTPEPDSPQDAVVAKQYKGDYRTFVSTAKYWTETYAVPKRSKADSIRKLMDMGFDEKQCEDALVKHDGDENRALDHLLMSSS